ncbi:dihydroneopterin aldolase [Rhodanobacter aciditrophus]|uniref:7,8-dihydroneopterin aldolase n=1 Tax=Rhodanobacter aciditrophus TaxID=1623218 RepID=A0ABW4AWX5_9GAMM
MILDTVFIEGLHTRAVIGVYEWEKEIWQDLVFDIEMEHDNRVPAMDDDLSKTLDYEAISNAIIEFCRTKQFELIETLAERLCAQLIEVFNLTTITMTLRKPGAVPAARAVGVKIRRTA